MNEKLKVGHFHFSAYSDAPLSPENLAKIFVSISKQVLRDGKSFLSEDLLEATVRFKYVPDENV